MEWKEKLQRIIDLTENHLQREESPVDRNEIAKIAECSYGFFQKVFSYMNGIGFAEYIRERKLTLAGYELKSTDKKVIDISYQYGYDSPTSFTKAFWQFHGVTPKEARDPGVVLRVTPKMQILGDAEYSWRLVQKEGFRLVGINRTVSCKEGQHFAGIPAFWSECQRNGVFARLLSMDLGDPAGLFGVFDICDERLLEISYSIMVRSEQSPPPGFVQTDIPAATWAVFDCKGPVPQAIQEGWRYLREEWLVKYPFRHARCPEVEWYSSGNAYDEAYLSQIWIPVMEEELT